MPEQELNSPAAKFISSLVRSLQILCNGQVDFNESIELVGHINVRVDRKFKFDYIVDEQVSREGGDSSTTFLSNSYHSCPPLKQSNKKVSPPEFEQDVMFSDVPQNVHKRGRQSKNSVEISGKHQLEESSVGGDESIQNYSVAIESMARESGQSNQMVVKIEGGDDSNDCMVLPASPGDYEPVGEVSGAENFPVAGTSGSFDESISIQMNRTRKRRKANDQSTDERDSQGEMEREKASGGGKRSASELLGKFAAYECSYCSVIVTDYDDLSLHNKSCPSPSCSMICLTCGEKLPSKPEMRQHLKLMHNHKTFGCKFCDMMFLSSSGLLSHTKAKHKPDPKTLCQVCGQAFHNRANLEGHMNMHLGIKPFKCKKCGKGYGHSKSLMTHEKMCKKPMTSLGKARSQSNLNHPPHSSTSGSNPLHPRKVQVPVGNKRNAPASDQSFSFNDSYQPFEDSKKLCNDGSDLEDLQHPVQPYSYSGPSYEPLQSMALTNMANTSNASGAVNNSVYVQPNNEFVLPHVGYDMYPQEMLQQGHR